MPELIADWRPAIVASFNCVGGAPTASILPAAASVAAAPVASPSLRTSRRVIPPDTYDSLDMTIPPQRSSAVSEKTIVDPWQNATKK